MTADNASYVKHVEDRRPRRTLCSCEVHAYVHGDNHYAVVMEDPDGEWSFVRQMEVSHEHQYYVLRATVK